MLRDSFTDVFRGHSQRADSVRHEYSQKYKHCHFILCPSSNPASISKPRPFLESFDKCLTLFVEINEKFRESYM